MINEMTTETLGTKLGRVGMQGVIGLLSAVGAALSVVLRETWHALVAFLVWKGRDTPPKLEQILMNHENSYS